MGKERIFMSLLRLFVSHSHQDNAWCDRFVTSLQSLEVDVWYDRQGLYVGSQWVKIIQEELQSRDIFVVVLSPASWTSEWVQEELALAFSQRKRIIGLIHELVPLDGFITSRQVLSVIGQEGPTVAKTLVDLLSSEGAPLGNPTDTPSSLISLSPSELIHLFPSTDKQPYQSLGVLLKAYRHMKQLSQREMAKRLGVSEPVIPIYELGVRLPSPSMIDYLGSGMELSEEEMKHLHHVYELLAGSSEKRSENPTTPEGT
jgi:DNA-binding XRE family transcriptional regulator